MFLDDDAVACLPSGGPPVPVSPSCWIACGLHGLELCKQLIEESTRVGDDGLLQMGMELLKLGRVDVDDDLVRLASEVLRGITGDGHVETRAKHEQEIAVLQSKVGAARSNVAGTSNEGGMIGGNQVRSAPCGYGWNIEQKPQLRELLLGAC